MMVLRGDSEKVRSGAKTRPSGTTANTLPRDDDAKGPSSDPAERGEKHCSRQAVRRQSQDDRQMEGPRVYVRRANGPEKSLLERHSRATTTFSRRTTKRSFSSTAGAPASRSTTALTDSRGLHSRFRQPHQRPDISAMGGHPPIDGRDERERCARKRSEAERVGCARSDRSGRASAS